MLTGLVGRNTVKAERLGGTCKSLSRRQGQPLHLSFTRGFTSFRGVRNPFISDHGVLGSTQAAWTVELSWRSQGSHPPAQVPSGPQTPCACHNMPLTHPNMTHPGSPASCLAQPHVAKRGQPEPAGTLGKLVKDRQLPIYPPAVCGSQETAAAT